MAPSDVHAVIERLYSEDRIPALGGLGRYPGWVHVDVRPRIEGHLCLWTGEKVGDEIAA